MRNVDSAYLAALVGARDNGIAPRRFFWITARRFDNDSVESFGLWTGDEAISLSIQSAATGATVTREYHGAGLILDIGSIPRVSDLTIQTITVDLSQVADHVQAIVRGYDLRLAKVEIHEATLDPATRELAAPPAVAFLGEVDGSTIETPAMGGEGSAKLTLVSDAISMLARKNSRKSSYEGQKRRGGDQFGRYASTVATWTIPWGEKA